MSLPVQLPSKAGDPAGHDFGASRRPNDARTKWWGYRLRSSPTTYIILLKSTFSSAFLQIQLNINYLDSELPHQNVFGR
jgi:hypothetical protein